MNDLNVIYVFFFEGVNVIYAGLQKVQIMSQWYSCLRKTFIEAPFSSFSFQVYEDLCLDSRLFFSFKSHFYRASIAVIIESFDQGFLRISPQVGCAFRHYSQWNYLQINISNQPIRLWMILQIVFECVLYKRVYWASHQIFSKWVLDLQEITKNFN